MPPELSPATFPARRVLVAVSGSIAAVQAPQACLVLRHMLGCEVRTVITRSAARFVTADALSAITGRPCAGGVQPDDALEVPHLELTRDVDLVLVLPATANVLAKAAQGIADDLLTTCLLASRAPIVFAPCMNDAMWMKPAVQRNVHTLLADGHGVVLPVTGIALSDGQTGVGAMPDVLAVLREAAAFVARAASLRARGACGTG